MRIVSLETLFSHATGHLSVACLFCYLLLDWFEPRRTANLARLICTLLALACIARFAAAPSDWMQQTPWILAGVFAAWLALRALLEWTRAVTAKPPNRTVAAKAVSLLALVSTTVAQHLWGFQQYGNLPSYWNVVAGLQWLGISSMLGISLFLVFQLTFISSPDALGPDSSGASVNWRGVARITLLSAVTLVACCLCQFLIKPPVDQLSSNAATVHVAARMFGLVLLLATFVVWFIPRRIGRFQSLRKVPKDWISLSLTAWLGMFAFVVSATLPADWPWRVLLQ